MHDGGRGRVECSDLWECAAGEDQKERVRLGKKGRDFKEGREGNGA